MTASATIAYASTELRHPRHVGDDDQRRTIRVRPGRGNARRRAIAESAGWVRR